MKSLAIVFPIHPKEESLELRLQDLDSFFTKWPLVTDVYFVIEPKQSSHRQQIEKFHNSKINLHIVENSKTLGRAGSIQNALKDINTDLVILGSLDLSIPMAEYFNLIHEAVTQKDVMIFKGNRFTSRKKISGVRSSWHKTLEDIILEKFKSKNPAANNSIQDPLCNLYALRPQVTEKIRSSMPLKQWYYGLDIIQLAHKENLKICELGVTSTIDAKSRIPLLREYLRHLL